MMAIVSVAVASCATGETNPAVGSAAAETSPPVVVDLSPYGGSEPPGVEFSSDGHYILCWWYPHPPIGEMGKMIGRCVVFDPQGRVVVGASDERGRLTEDFVMRFPTTAVRQHFADFLKNTNDLDVVIWGFSKGYALGFRTLAKRGENFAPGTAELWHLAPKQERIWAITPPELGSYPGIAAFLGADSSDPVLLAYGAPNKAYILSPSDGTPIDKFTCGKPETEADELAYKRKFHLAGELGDPSFSFFAGPLSFDASRRLLACGAAEGRRVRVVSVDKPHKLVFEAHTNENPHRPFGGEWSVDSVYFAGGGRFLAAGYHFAGRATRKRITEAEVFDTVSWQVVWSAKSEGRSTSRPPSISPDGRIAALIRDTSLEIGPFVAHQGGKGNPRAK